MNKNGRGENYGNYRVRNAMGEKRNYEGRNYNIWGRYRNAEMKALEEHGTFVRILKSEIPKGSVSIDGRFAYNTQSNPLHAGHARTESYRCRKKADSRFCAQYFLEAAGLNGAAPTAQLKSLWYY